MILPETTDLQTAQLVVELTDVYKGMLSFVERCRTKTTVGTPAVRNKCVAQTIKYADILDNSRELLQHHPHFGNCFLNERKELLSIGTRSNKELYHRALSVADTVFKSIQPEISAIQRPISCIGLIPFSLLLPAGYFCKSQILNCYCYDTDRYILSLSVFLFKRTYLNRSHMPGITDHPYRMDSCSYMGGDLPAEFKGRQENQGADTRIASSPPIIITPGRYILSDLYAGMACDRCGISFEQYGLQCCSAAKACCWCKF